jgi:hypothetical protein
MRSIINARTFLLAFISMLLLVGCFLLGHFVVTQIAIADSQIAISDTDNTELNEIGINEDGLSYGTIASVTEDGQFPDLLSVVATNGLEGYIYTAESNLTNPPAANPEEAIEITNEREERVSQSFVPLLSAELGLEITADTSSALEIYRAAMTFVTPTAPGEMLMYSEEAKVALAEAANLQILELPENEELQLAIYRALENAREYIEIPVYENDGKTLIGVFRQAK